MRFRQLDVLSNAIQMRRSAEYLVGGGGDFGSAEN